jgi:hypothetical protein
MSHHVPWPKRRPTELFCEQCFISIEADAARRLPRLREIGLEGCVFRGVNYPHYDRTYPGAVKEREDKLALLDPALADNVSLADRRTVSRPDVTSRVRTWA